MDIPESVEKAQIELQQIAGVLSAVEQWKARYAFLTGWLAAQGENPEEVPAAPTNGKPKVSRRRS